MPDTTTMAPSGPASPIGGNAAAEAADHEGQGLLVEDDMLVEEISIDGMCGVY